MPLLTSHASFLAITGDGTVIHRQCGALQSGERFVDIAHAALHQHGNFLNFTDVNDQVLEFAWSDDALPPCTVRVEPDLNRLTLQSGELFLSVSPDSEQAGFSADLAGQNEFFVHVSADDMADLAFLAENEWVVRATRQILRRGEIQMLNGFRLMIGDIITALPDTLPLLRQCRVPQGLGPHRPRLRDVTLVFDHWKLQQIVLFRPLVYSVAFRSPLVMEQLRLCLNSLTHPGRYTGHAQVVTDRTREQLLEIVAPYPGDKLRIQTANPSDFVGYNAAKYLIADDETAYGFQPVLFVDTDTIFDRDIERLLVAILLADRVCAPGEQYSPLRSSKSVGADLLHDDNQEVGEAYGFNAGTFGLQNLDANRDFMMAVRAVMMGYVASHGRGELEWADQGCANYVAFKLGLVDMSSITWYVQFGEASRMANGERRGLVHFWPDGRGEDRTEAMRRYVADLAITDPADDVR